jgi:hypothetical protein
MEGQLIQEVAQKTILMISVSCGYFTVPSILKLCCVDIYNLLTAEVVCT